MECPVFLYKQGDSEYMRTYVLDFSEIPNPETDIVLDVATTKNLNRPAEIIFAKISKRVEDAIRKGEGHMFFGEIKKDGYKGMADVSADYVAQILEYEGRTIDGWKERIFDIIYHAADSGKELETIRPGMKAESLMRKMHELYLTK